MPRETVDEAESKEPEMDKELVAAELTKLARELVGGSGNAEFRKQIDAVTDLQTFVEDDAMDWAAFAGRDSQKALGKAADLLAKAREAMYDALNARDKNVPM